MNNATCCPEVTLPANPIAQLWHVMAARWARHLEAARKAHDFDFVTEMSAETLRDIGAPEHLISRAVQQRETQQQHLWELRQWRDG
jgi:hypothetical protein